MNRGKRKKIDDFFASLTPEEQRRYNELLHYIAAYLASGRPREALYAILGGDSEQARIDAIAAELLDQVDWDGRL